jgi:hypothetical protein
MSVTINDPALLSQLAAGQEVELKDPSGRVLGVFILQVEGPPPPEVHSPFSDEELEKRRRQPQTGRPLADILRDLQARQ